MRKYLFFLSLWFFSEKTFGAPIIWTGAGGDGLWTTTANWSTNTLPGSTDDVTFNTNVAVTISGGSLYTLNSLTITNNSSVIFNYNTTTRNIRLISTSLAALRIDASSTLTCDISAASGTNNSSLILYGNGSIGTIAGNLFFTSSGGLSSSCELNTYTSNTQYGVVTLASGAVIRYAPNTGNTTASLIPTSTFIAANGSTYELTKNGGSIPVGTWGVTSLVKINNSSGNTAPSFNGNSYGNLEWNIPNQSSTLSNFFNQSISFNDVNLIHTNSANANGELRIAAGASALSYTMVIAGNLTITANSRLVITASSVTGSNGAKLSIAGNVNNVGTISTAGAIGTINELEFNGTSLQSITNSGTLSGASMDVIINNATGITLTNDLTLPGNTSNSLQLTSGNLKTAATPNGLLAMIDNAGYTGGSTTSMVEGPLKKIGDEDFIYPIGKGQIFAPVSLSGGVSSAITDAFTIEYLRTNPQTAVTNGTVVGAGINHVSYVEYWMINKDAGSGALTKLVGLDAHRTSFVLDPTSGNTFVSRHDGAQWNQLASSSSLASTGSCASTLYQCGFVTTITAISTFSPFTLATDQTTTINPLPITLTNFDAVKLNSSEATIKWDLAACCSKLAKFELLKSTDGINYTTLTVLAGSEINTAYNHTDTRLSNGKTYYRLKGIDESGRVTYSRVVAVFNGIDGVVLTTMWPNPAASEISVNIGSSTSQAITVLVYNLSGKQVLQSQMKVVAGNTTVILPIRNLPSGNYYVVLQTAEGVKTTKGFTKQ